ncbi:thiamine pyrophosphate-dependent enzyme [Streptomyces sp. NPDC094032]|uniref:thiamine pyrophosphate-dependent enzyme n=1 Tax=Streptomyces sp. NPDC094032 TaxID=3155308 RepID=UPI003326963E
MAGSVAARIAERLVEEGVAVVFTVPGEQIDALLGELARAGVRLVHTRHEQAAAMMAYGYARSTGRVGVFACVSGPGVLYSSAGLALGYAGDARMLCLAGQIPTAAIGRGHGLPHELPDQLGILRRLTGWSERLDRPERTDTVLTEAFHRLRHGRPRPVAVEIPMDVLTAQAIPQAAETTDRATPQATAETTNQTAAQATTEAMARATAQATTRTTAQVAPQASTQATTQAPALDPRPASPVGPDPAPDPDALRRARAMLGQAESPLIFVGSGAREAGAEVLRLARLLQAPVTADTGGRGIVPDDHELALPLLAAQRLWPRTDVVLAVGTRLMRPQARWGTHDRLKVIRVDLDAAELDRVAAPAVGIVADAAETVRALADGIPAQPPRTRWQAAVRDARDRTAADVSRLVPQLDHLAAIRAALPADGFFVEELTQVGIAARLAFPVLRPYTYVISTYQECLGFGFATALGVQVANPGKAVLSVSGDGGFLYTSNELATAVLHRIPVVAVVFNDNAYGNVARSQRNRFGHSVATELLNPDLVRLAEAFGAYGVRVKTPDDLRGEIEAAFARGGPPTVIEVPVGEMPSPWPLIHRRQEP